MTASTSPISINRNTTYFASAWIKTKKGHAYIQIDHMGNGKWLGPHKAQVRVVKDEWTFVTIESDPNKYPNATHLTIGITSDGPDVEVYVDDVVLMTAEAKNKEAQQTGGGDAEDRAPHP